jgi:dipeptidyl aminopeptidase/acylaminoacyl peptidase
MAEDTTAITPELMLDGLSPSQVAVSPDGRWVAYVVGPVVAGGPVRGSALWIAESDGSSPARQLTDGKGRVAAPRWEPDSRGLVFLAGGRLSRIGVDGGDERELTAWDGAVFAHYPLAGGELIALIGAEDETEDEAAAGDVIVWGTEPGDGLWLLTPGEPAPRRVTALSDRHVVAVGPRPDGGALAVITWAVPADEPGARTARLHVVDPRTGAARDLGPTAFDSSCPVWWRADGGWHVSYLGIATDTRWGAVGGTAVLDVLIPADEAGDDAAANGPAAEVEPRNLTAGMASCPTELVQVADGPPLALFAEGLDTTVRRLDPATGRFERDALVQGLASTPAADRTGEVVALRVSGPYDPNDVYVRRGDEPFRRVSDTRSHYRAVTWGTQERLEWTAPDGLTLGGLLVLPPGRRREDGPFPLFTMVHGGPYGRYADNLQFNSYVSAQWLAAAGHAVLLPNPRGSQGRGHAFARVVAGEIGGDEFTDVLTAIDRLVADGVADPERLSIGGWSHGGYLAAWAAARTDRFRASIVGAGIADWGLQVTCGELGMQEADLCGFTGWEGVGPHRHDAVSPISYAADIRTPVLILHGEADTNVPLAQAVSLQRALAHHDVPHEVAVYPGEGHIVAGRAHQMDILRRMRDFLGRHVG